MSKIPDILPGQKTHSSAITSFHTYGCPPEILCQQGKYKEREREKKWKLILNFKLAGVSSERKTG